MVNRLLPNIGDVAANREELAWADAVHLDVLQAAYKLNGILGGCAPSAGSGALEVDIGVGCVVIDGVAKTVAAQTVAPATGTGLGSNNRRLDLITVNTSGTVVVNAGVVSTVPVYKSIPANEVVICGVLVIDGQTTIVTGDINDMRIDLSRQPFVMNRITAATGTPGGGSAIYETLYTYTIPGRALGTTGGVHLTMIGELLTAVTNPSLQHKISLGATTIFETGNQGQGTSSDVRAWIFDIYLMAVSSLSAQKIAAFFNTGPVDTLNTMNLKVTSSVDGRPAWGFNDLSVENMANDLILKVESKLSVSNANNSIQCQMATLERIPPV